MVFRGMPLFFVLFCGGAIGFLNKSSDKFPLTEYIDKGIYKRMHLE